MNRYTVAQVSVIQSVNGLKKPNGVFTTVGRTFKTEAAAKSFITKSKKPNTSHVLGNGEMELLSWIPAEVFYDESEMRNFVKVGKLDRYYI